MNKYKVLTGDARSIEDKLNTLNDEKDFMVLKMTETNGILTLLLELL